MSIRKKMLAVLTMAPLILGVAAISPSASASTASTASTAAKKPAKPARKPAKPAKKPAGKAKPGPTVYEKQVAGLPARFTKQKLDWTPCDAKITDDKVKPFWAGARCALLTAPLDYAKPAGQTIKIAIDEELAAPGDKSPGLLMTNPGGPGGAGLPMAAQLTNTVNAPSELHYDFDIVGMNPRGVGPNDDRGQVNSTNDIMGIGATALTCATEGVSYRRPKLPDWASPALRALAESAAYQEAACQKSAGGIRPYITTPNTARDIDLLRIVLGQPKIDYYGVSYGTFLGAVYGAMFPHDLNRMVIDGSMSPKVSWYAEVRFDNEALVDNFNAFAAWAVANKQGLGGTREAVRTTVDNLYADTEKSDPEPLGGYTPAKLSKDIGEFTRYRPDWAEFAASLRNALAADSGGKVDPEITQDVDSASALVPVSSAIDPRGDTVSVGVYNAVTCNWPWPKPNAAGYKVYEDNIAYWNKRFPYAGAASTAGPRACTYLSYQPEKLPVIAARGPYPKGLVVSTDGDTQTPLSMATEMAKTLGFDLITVTNDGTHGIAFAGNTCATDAVTNYLVDGKLPGNISCPTIKPPADLTSLTIGAAAAADPDGLDAPVADAIATGTQQGQ